VSESAGYLRYVPYAEPYDHQREAMAAIRAALAERRDVLFEGATGTGKTLAALAPALEYARAADKTVVITTNVHQQMRQFRREAAAIAETEDIRAIVFRGKSSMCHIDVGYQECQALRDTTRDLVEGEREEAKLEREQRALLERMQDGDDEAAETRSAIMDELAAVEDSVGALADQPTCDHHYRNLTADTTDFFAWLYDGVRSPDDIYEFAHERGLCGYELLKEGVEGVDLVVCNYHHLLDPTIREQFFRWLGREPEDVVAIFDEAHNVEDAAREHARRTLSERTLEGALDECEDEEDPRTDAAANVIGAFLAALETASEAAFDFGEREQVGTEWHDLPIDNEDRRDEVTLAFLRDYAGPGVEADIEAALDLGRDLDRQYERAYRNGERDVRRDCQVLQAATFLEDWLADSDDTGTYPVVSVRRDGRGDGAMGGDREGRAGDVYGRAELYTCIPDRVTQDLFDGLAASVLMSATLRPFDVTEAVLGLEDPETLAYGQQFPEDRRRTLVVDGPALFASKRDEPSVQETVTAALEDAIRFTPGNTLAFFPSYAEAERYHDRLDVEATTHLDEAGTPARDLRAEFAADDNAALLTSLWGTLGEGVSYDGDDARTAVVVGVPYPHLDERMEAVQAAYADAFDVEGSDSAGWRYAVEVPTVRKIRQALGRVVRSPDDFGARILVDARYTERAEVQEPGYAVRGTFPPAERAEMVDLEPVKLKFALRNFYQDMDAYAGDPPSP
jgi:DNA excision repair protein ERCC-2